MNRYLSIDVLRGLIMIIMALDHVIGALAIHPATEVSFSNNMFPGYINGVQQWSRLLTHLCAPGFQLLAGMGLAMSVARAQQAGTTSSKITSDLLNRGQVLILADLLLMLPVFRLPMFFMVLACIGSCTLCFVFLRFLPRHVIGLVGVAIILTAPLYKTDMMLLPGAGQQLTSTSFLIDIWTRVGFGDGALGILYPILPWLGIFAIGWWIGLQLIHTPKEQGPYRSSLQLSIAGLILVLLGLGLRMSGWTVAEAIPLKDATLMDPAFWQFTKYPPSWVFICLTIGVLLLLLGLFRLLLDRPDQSSPLWAKIVSVYGRTALFYFVAHFYLIGLIAIQTGMVNVRNDLDKMSFGMAYLYWLLVLVIMWPVCFVYDKLRQRYRTVLRYF